MKNCCFKLILSVVFLLIMADVHAQNVRVTGVVSDTQGPLIGVNVRVKDSATGVITDITVNILLRYLRILHLCFRISVI